MIQKELLDNTTDTFMVIDIKKPQPVFFPKEESQVFQNKEYDWIAADPEKNSDNQSQEAFDQRATGSYLPLNSSHTATDFIGATSINVPINIKDEFTDFTVYDLNSNTTKNLYEDTDAAQKLNTITNGIHRLRVPKNCFNTILDSSDTDAIEANGGSTTKKNYGLYYISIRPKYVETVITNVINKKHIAWDDIEDNDAGSGNPDFFRRNIYECDKNDFMDTPWSFETNPEQSGRLLGSVVEIWDANGIDLKQVKVMIENIFNFPYSGLDMQFGLSPDNMGYDPVSQIINVGDIIRVYPRETYFNEVTLEVAYKDTYLQVENMVSFMINDVARDMQTGSYQVYDEKGLKVEPTGLITGNVKHRYQISQTDRFEIRRRIKE